ncbi:MAG: hypothetical protein E7269_00410 [Lachnospiraceae bacterium]|nr:hypothetical protein [Lachnospiraceae bacterium]
MIYFKTMTREEFEQLKTDIYNTTDELVDNVDEERIAFYSKIRRNYFLVYYHNGCGVVGRGLPLSTEWRGIYLEDSRLLIYWVGITLSISVWFIAFMLFSSFSEQGIFDFGGFIIAVAIAAFIRWTLRDSYGPIRKYVSDIFGRNDWRDIL